MADLEIYPPHGGQLSQIAERFNVPRSELLDFSANINPSGPPASVLSTLRNSLDDLSAITEYPDLEQTELRKAVARYAGTGAENVVVANGFVPLLEATLRTLHIRACLLPAPCFLEYRRTLERMGIALTSPMLSPEANFRYDPATLLSGEQDAILMANPQNPSGVLHDLAWMSDFVTQAFTKNKYVLLDEAFVDYLPETSLTSRIEGSPNLILFRSVTKFFAIPGLRVAYALASSSHAAAINEALAPWPITTLASRAVITALNDPSYCAQSRSENLNRRIALRTNLISLGLGVSPSAANFLLFQLPPTIDPGAFWRHMIVHHHIVLRSCANYYGLPEGHFRACIRTENENKKLAAAIEQSLSELGGSSTAGTR